MTLVGNPTLVMVMHDSDAVVPIAITVRVGSHAGVWGLGAVLEVPSVFKLCDSNPTVCVCVCVCLIRVCSATQQVLPSVLTLVGGHTAGRSHCCVGTGGGDTGAGGGHRGQPCSGCG